MYTVLGPGASRTGGARTKSQASPDAPMAETALAYSIPKGIGLRDDQGVESVFFTASLAPGSRRGSISRRVLRCILLAACLAMPALPQCQMCRTAAAAQQEKAAKALFSAVSCSRLALRCRPCRSARCAEPPPPPSKRRPPRPSTRGSWSSGCLRSQFCWASAACYIVIAMGPG